MGEGRSVSETLTWSVATVTTVMVVICFVFVTCEWLKKTWLKAVLSSLQKIKEGEKSWRFKFNPSFSSYQLFY
ncbi:hypothetical protein MRB53_023346 [Persea americana]|uniref:Uncharacterized protein n=1 Tax=Persea americana TaxID=3435 RepID=A0ACC2L9P5_PERAE|nr:hypothetical protein MRB53_023346 [Persea americana]